MLRRQYLRVGRRRIHALMTAAGLVLPRDSEGPRDPAIRGPVTTPEPNRRIAVDFTTVWTAEDGTVAVAIGVDCGCRSVLDVTVTKSQSSGAILASADRALQAAFGSPAEVPDCAELRRDTNQVVTPPSHRHKGHHYGSVPPPASHPKPPTQSPIPATQPTKAPGKPPPSTPLTIAPRGPASAPTTPESSSEAPRRPSPAAPEP